MSASKHYFDLQVNGYGGVDFNGDDLTPQSLHQACRLLQADGARGILATIITDHIPAMCGRLRRLAEFRQRDPLARQIITGLHAEGPFISPIEGYHGAHPRHAVIPADLTNMNRLIDAADGLLRLVTLAPEHDNQFAVTTMLAKQGIVVSAGHCNSKLDQLKGAIDAGLTMFTHLGNGCPLLLPRHDNIIQRVLSLRQHLWICFIADGAHVNFPALGNYIRCAGLGRCIIVSDTIAVAGLGPGQYTMGQRRVLIDKDGQAMAPDRSHLLGATTSLGQARINLIEKLGLSGNAVRRLTEENPRKAMGSVKWRQDAPPVEQP